MSFRNLLFPVSTAYFGSRKHLAGSLGINSGFARFLPLCDFGLSGARTKSLGVPWITHGHSKDTGVTVLLSAP